MYFQTCSFLVVLFKIITDNTNKNNIEFMLNVMHPVLEHIVMLSNIWPCCATVSSPIRADGHAASPPGIWALSSHCHSAPIRIIGFTWFYLLLLLPFLRVQTRDFSSLNTLEICIIHGEMVKLLMLVQPNSSLWIKGHLLLVPFCMCNSYKWVKSISEKQYQDWRYSSIRKLEIQIWLGKIIYF